MATALEFIAAACLGAVAYSYLLYPPLLVVVASLIQAVRDGRYVLGKRDRREACESALPTVAVIIAARDEQAHIAARIGNLLALDYPSHLLEILVGSDGSTDGTAAILAAVDDPRVRAFVFERNRGKASVLNDLVATTTQEIVVFSDANSFFERGALRALVAHFIDPRVGGVSGELRIKGTAGDNQDSLYWRIEQFLKFFEARIGGLLGANGAIYAIRRDLWQPLPADTICDDFCVAMNVAATRRRLAYEPTAWAEEDAPAAIADEYKRRVRIGIGNFQALMRHPEYLWRTSIGTLFAYVSHKILRWIAPHLLIVALIASLLLGRWSSIWLAFGLLQLLCYLIAAAAYAASRNGRRLPGLLRIPAFLFALNWAFLVASVRYASGRYGGPWQRTHR